MVWLVENGITLIDLIISGSLFGDPLVETLDGVTYEYRSIGEYWLIYSTPFLLQGRLVESWDAQGRPRNGTTVLGAVAAIARDQADNYNYGDMDSSRIHVAMTEDRKGE